MTKDGPPTFYVWTTSYGTNEPDPDVAASDAREYFLELLSRPDWRDHLIVAEV